MAGQKKLSLTTKRKNNHRATIKLASFAKWIIHPQKHAPAKAINKARRFYQTLIEILPDAFYVNIDDSIAYVNKASLDLFGAKSEEQLIGHSPFEFILPEDQKDVQDRINQVISGNQVPIKEGKVIRLDGTIIDVEIRASSFIENGKNAVLVLLHDISERKQADEALKRHSAELTASNQSLEAYAYSVSHDLRNPLHSILACTEVVRDAISSDDSDTQKALDYIKQSSERMGLVITDLLALSKITKQEVHYTPINLSEMASAIFEELKILHPGRRVQYIIEPNLIVAADEGLVWMLMQNFLYNAWKFTSKKENARIEFGKTAGNDTPCYFIRDNGVGFDMSQANRLFKPFQRLHSNQEYSGTGIGLTIVKRIVEKHGGTIHLEAEKDMGATFYFSLGA